MRVFKRINEPASPEDMAVAVRLQAVTDRGRIEVRQYSNTDTANEVQGLPRLFHRPDEIVAESGVA